MRKNPQDSRDESLPSGRLRENTSNRIGKIFSFLPFIVVAIIVIVAVYYLTKISSQTYSIKGF